MHPHCARVGRKHKEKIGVISWGPSLPPKSIAAHVAKIPQKQIKPRKRIRSRAIPSATQMTRQHRTSKISCTNQGKQNQMNGVHVHTEASCSLTIRHLAVQDTTSQERLMMEFSTRTPRSGAFVFSSKCQLYPSTTPLHLRSFFLFLI